MTWPTTTIVTTDMDSSSDNPGNARAQILQIALNVNSIKDARNQANGIAPLDSSGLLPLANLNTVPAVKGGTGQVSYSVGDLLYADSTTTLAKLSAGTANKVLTSGGAGNPPSWQPNSLTGAITGSGLTQNTAKLLGRTTASNGAIEEISVGSGLSMSAGTLAFSAFKKVLVTDSTDIGLAAAGGSQSNIGGSFAANIPANGLIRMMSFAGRIINNATSIQHNTSFGIRIGTTNYWFDSVNGSPIGQFNTSNTANTTNDFIGAAFYSAGINGNPIMPCLDIAAAGIPTGNQTIQLIAGYVNAQTTLKGSVKQTRVQLEIIE